MDSYRISNPPGVTPMVAISVKIVSGGERSGIPDTIKMSEAAGRSYGDSIEQLRSFEQLMHVVL